MANYNSTHTGQEIDQAATKALNPDSSPTASSAALVTSGGVKAALDTKVDKVTGKGLSSNDFTDALKTKLDGIEAGAQVNAVTGVKGNSEGSYRTGNVNITKDNIGLGNVDNTADANKPVSTAQAAAINALYPHDTVSDAAVASFPDGADGIPVRDLTIDIDAVQDLHGYDSPWPGGGGKNKLAPAYSAGTTKTANDVNYLFNSDGTVSVSGTCSDTNSWQDVVSNFSLPAGTYTLSGGVSNSIYLSLRDYNNVSIATSKSGADTFTISETTTVRVRACVLANTVVPSNTVLRPMLESGTTATTYAPYSNLCPISGFTGANVTRTGKNLLSGKIDDATIGSSGRISSSNSYDVYVANVKQGATYVLSGNTDNNGYVIAYYTSYPQVGSYSYNNTRIIDTDTKVFTAEIDGYVVVRAANTDTQVQLELGSTASSYEPYSGTTIPISWQTEAGTVYAGTLDVTTGVLTVTDANIAAYNGETLPGAWISSMDIYAEGTTPTTGAQVVYKLATPQTYQLTPTEVTTLLGQNNVWADTGNTAVDYRADPTLYIDKKLEAL